MEAQGSEVVPETANNSTDEGAGIGVDTETPTTEAPQPSSAAASVDASRSNVQTADTRPISSRPISSRPSRGTTPREPSFLPELEETEEDSSFLEAVRLYGIALGLDPETQATLLWIPKQALTDLPAFWTYTVSDGKVAFLNTTSNQNQPEHPHEEKYIALVKESVENVSKVNRGTIQLHEAWIADKKKDLTDLRIALKKLQTDKNVGSQDVEYAKIRIYELISDLYVRQAKLHRLLEGSTEPPLLTSPYDVLAMAEYLGMDPKQHAQLLWIAKQALEEPVPDGWVEQVDEEGYPSFYNAAENITLQQHPYDQFYVNLARDELSTVGRFRRLNETWLKFYDTKDRPYYYDFSNNTASYKRPNDYRFRASQCIQRYAKGAIIRNRNRKKKLALAAAVTSAVETLVSGVVQGIEKEAEAIAASIEARKQSAAAAEAYFAARAKAQQRQRELEEMERLAREEVEREAEAERQRQEEERLAAEAKRKEEARKQEEERLAEEERAREEARQKEEERLREEARVREEERRKEEERVAEAARLQAEEEARLSEEARLAEEARVAEEARLREEEEKRREEERVAAARRKEEEEALLATLDEEERVRELARFEAEEKARAEAEERRRQEEEARRREEEERRRQEEERRRQEEERREREEERRQLREKLRLLEEERLAQDSKLSLIEQQTAQKTQTLQEQLRLAYERIDGLEKHLTDVPDKNQLAELQSSVHTEAQSVLDDRLKEAHERISQLEENVSSASSTAAAAAAAAAVADAMNAHVAALEERIAALYQHQTSMQQTLDAAMVIASSEEQQKRNQEKTAAEKETKRKAAEEAAALLAAQEAERAAEEERARLELEEQQKRMLEARLKAEEEAAAKAEQAKREEEEKRAHEEAQARRQKEMEEWIAKNTIQGEEDDAGIERSVDTCFDRLFEVLWVENVEFVAATMIQNCVSEFLRRLAVKRAMPSIQEYLGEIHAAEVLQARVREMKMRGYLEAEYERIEKENRAMDPDYAATRIQSVQRGRAARKEVKHIRAVEHQQALEKKRQEELEKKHTASPEVVKSNGRPRSPLPSWVEALGNRVSPFPLIKHPEMLVASCSSTPPSSTPAHDPATPSAARRQKDDLPPVKSRPSFIMRNERSQSLPSTPEPVRTLQKFSVSLPPPPIPPRKPYPLPSDYVPPHEQPCDPWANCQVPRNAITQQRIRALIGWYMGPSLELDDTTYSALPQEQREQRKQAEAAWRNELGDPEKLTLLYNDFRARSANSSATPSSPPLPRIVSKDAPHAPPAHHHHHHHHQQHHHAPLPNAHLHAHSHHQDKRNKHGTPPPPPPPASAPAPHAAHHAPHPSAAAAGSARKLPPVTRTHSPSRRDGTPSSASGGTAASGTLGLHKRVKPLPLPAQLS